MSQSNHMPPYRKKTHRAMPLSALTGKLISPVLKRRGFRGIPILDHWPHIVGAGLAALSQPERLRHAAKDGATLIIRVEGAMALEIQHLAPLILERINSYYGTDMVKHIKIIQAPLHKAPVPRALRPPDKKDIDRAKAYLHNIKDPGLKQALSTLGAYILRDKS